VLSNSAGPSPDLELESWLNFTVPTALLQDHPNLDSIRLVVADNSPPISEHHADRPGRVLFTIFTPVVLMAEHRQQAVQCLGELKWPSGVVDIVIDYLHREWTVLDHSNAEQ